MASGKSPISYLLELASKRGIPQPEYSKPERTGGFDHVPNFITKVTFDGLTASGTGSSKKDSKNAAAEEIVKLLPTGDPVQELTEEAFEPSSSNPISILTEYAAKGKSLKPEFVVLDNDSNGSFKTKCTLVLGTGPNASETIEGIGLGSRKQTSRTESAQVVLQQLREKGYLGQRSSRQVSSQVNSSVGQLVPIDTPGCSSVDESQVESEPQVGNEPQVESQPKPEEKENDTDDLMQRLADNLRVLMKNTGSPAPDQIGIVSGSSRQQRSEKSSIGATGSYKKLVQKLEGRRKVVVNDVSKPISEGNEKVLIAVIIVIEPIDSEPFTVDPNNPSWLGYSQDYETAKDMAANKALKQLESDRWPF